VLLWLQAHLRAKPNYIVLSVSMQGRSWNSVDAFWGGLCSELYLRAKRHYSDRFPDGAMEEAMTLVGQEKFRALLQCFGSAVDASTGVALRTVLIIDEFDELERLEGGAVEGLLGLLRAKTQDEDGIHAFVGAGTYAAVRVNCAAGSPFNATDRVVMPPMTLAEVQELLALASNAWKVEIHKRYDVWRVACPPLPAPHVEVANPPCVEGLSELASVVSFV
jgi:hypothetical protein